MSLKDCVLSRFKEDVKATADKNKERKSMLAKGFSFSETRVEDEASRYNYLEHVVYDL